MRKDIASVIWSGLGKVGTKGVAFAFSVFLARLLKPEDFGLCGMVALFIALATLFTDCGFSAAIIRKVDRGERDFATVFWFQLVAGLCLCLLLCGFSPLIAAFFGRPELVSVTHVVSLNVLGSALAAVPYAKLRLAGRFRAISVVDVVASVGSGFVGLCLAWRAFGVWAVVCQGVAWSGLRAALLFAAARWLPQLTFSRESFRELFSFGWRQLTASLVNTTYSNLHALLIGRAFGAAETGLYNRAHYYTHEPGWLVQGTFSEVSYPALVEVQDDERLLRRRFLHYLGAAAAVMFAGLGVFAIFACEIVEFLVGPQWLSCVPYIRILALGSAVEPLRALCGLVFMSKGHMGLVVKLEAVQTGIGLVAVLPALPFGILAICWAKTLYHVAGFVISGALVWKRYMSH